MTMWAGRTVAGVLLSALFLLVLALPVAAATTLELSPAGGFAGTSVRISGAGFQPSLEVALCWDGPGCRDLGSVTAGADGTFIVQSSIPPGANPGPHEVWACQEDEATGTDCALTAVVTATVDAVTTTTMTTPPTTTTTLPPTTTQPPATPPTTTTSPTTTTTPSTTTSSSTTATTSPATSSPTTAPSTTATTLAARTSLTATSSTTLPIPDLAGAGDIEVFASGQPEPQAVASSIPAMAAVTPHPGVVPTGISTLGAVLLVVLAGAVAAGAFALIHLLR